MELQSTTNGDVEKVNLQLQDFIEDYHFKCIMTTDIHYVKKEDYKLHEVLLAIQQKKKMSDKKRWRFENNDYYLKSEEEMLKDLNGISRETIEKCFSGISEIFEKCKGVDFSVSDHLPKFCETKQEEDNLLRLMTLKRLSGQSNSKGRSNRRVCKRLRKRTDCHIGNRLQRIFLNGAGIHRLGKRKQIACRRWSRIRRRQQSCLHYRHHRCESRKVRFAV